MKTKKEIKSRLVEAESLDAKTEIGEHLNSVECIILKWILENDGTLLKEMFDSIKKRYIAMGHFHSTNGTTDHIMQILAWVLDEDFQCNGMSFTGS